MKGFLPGTLTLVIVLATAAEALADPITITDDQRRVWASTTTESPQAQASDTLLAATSSRESTATLISSYANPMHWFGTGTVNVSAPVTGEYIASSSFRVDFTVTSPVTYTFDGSYAVASLFPTTCCGSVGSFFLREASTWPLFSVVNGVSGTGSDAATHSFTGLLMPGEYVFQAHAGARAFDATGSASGAFAFTFDFTPADSAPVPEPASLLLLGTGLAGMLGNRCRKANRRQTRND